ncbi:MAG: hypothetical protein Tsb0014_03260 [Pleurocapsa sp.]
MKNKNFSQLLRVRKKNSGFTLLELLTGLIMSTIVIGAIGFGLMQILRTTKDETSKIKVRSETSRALDFVSDEIKRARSIESDASNAPNFPGGTVVLALEIPEISDHIDVDGDGDLIGSDDDDTTSERVIYYLGGGGTTWEGPQVLYRWGPPLDGSGEYTENNWTPEALIDRIDDTTITNDPCTGTQTLNPAIGTAAGFYACIENSGISAQLYFEGEIDAVAGSSSETYAADTQVVARARDDAAKNDAIEESDPDSVQTLSPSYACSDSSEWMMRTDFTTHSSTTPDDTTLNNSEFSWLRDPDNDDRQPQPFQLGDDDYLTITSSPVGRTGCNRGRGNEYRKTKNDDGTYSLIDPQTATTGEENSEALSDYEHKLQLQLDIGNWEQLNLEYPGKPYYPTVNGVPSGTTPVVMIKKGDKLSTTDDSLLFKGYDPDGDSSTETEGSQVSLAEFLFRKGLYNHPDPDQQVDYTDPDATFDPLTFEIIGLAPNERIIAVEIGQAYSSADPAINTGYDLQDNVFIFKSDKLKNSNIFPGY